MRSKEERLYKILQNRALQHTLFWGISYFILLNLFASSGKIQKIDYIYTVIFQFPLLIGIYINILILIPGFLSKKKYLLYILAASLTIAGCSQLNIIIFEKLINYVLPGYYFISYYDLFDILKFTIVYFAISSLLKFSKSWFLLSDTNRRLSQLQKEKIESELKALKGQINPHFLFNSMNSIYSLALSHSEKTPEIVLKLSDIMRYIIYEANTDFVDLAKEINYLKDYIVLQKLRTDNRASISFDITGSLENIKIAPLLFFPLVENSFKHGIKGATGKSFVNIDLLISEKGIKFIIENNKGITDNVEKKEYKGIGLDNVMKRLEMTYPGWHELKIANAEETFKVELTINHVL
jgi:sensor histidine kinase YesM